VLVVGGLGQHLEEVRVAGHAAIVLGRAGRPAGEAARDPGGDNRTVTCLDCKPVEPGAADVLLVDPLARRGERPGDAPGRLSDLIDVEAGIGRPVAHPRRCRHCAKLCESALSHPIATGRTSCSSASVASPATTIRRRMGGRMPAGMTLIWRGCGGRTPYLKAAAVQLTLPTAGGAD